MATETAIETLTAEDTDYIDSYKQLRAAQHDVTELVAATDAALLGTGRSAVSCEKAFAGTPAAASRTTFGKRLARARNGTKRTRGGRKT
jgi:hypothetical protein